MRDECPLKFVDSTKILLPWLSQGKQNGSFRDENSKGYNVNCWIIRRNILNTSIN